MDLYTFLLIAHVLGAVVWVGGNVLLQAMAQRMVSRADAATFAMFLDTAAKVGVGIFVPASLVVIASGATMAWTHWGFDNLFIILGLAGFVVVFVLGLFHVAPAAERIAAMLAEGPHRLDEAKRRFRRIQLSWLFDLALLIGIVVLMELKIA